MIENLPFSALRVFESAARHLSFKRAAEELFITPAAVSQQIKTLEHQLGVQLFHRHSRGLSLTDAARAGLPALTGGLEQLVEAVNRMREENGQASLTVWMAPSFAARWLVPRLNRFYDVHPEIDLTITASKNLIDSKTSPGGISAESLARDNVDVAVRFGKGNYPGCRVDKLFPVAAVPLCSPRLLEGEHPLRCPDDLRHHTLLHDDTAYEGRPDWATWLAAAGVDDIDDKHGIHFNHVNLALTAAAEGQGVVLSIHALASEDIAAGRLVVPFDIALPLEYAYYVITREDRNDHLQTLQFRDWIVGEARAESHASGPEAAA